MIIQTGQRTDIPAFYSKWFMKRLEEGFVLVRNPYNPSSVTRYDLSPDVVDLLAFCTKNPAPMLSHIDELKAYGQYWFVTITPYGRDIEPNVPVIWGKTLVHTIPAGIFADTAMPMPTAVWSDKTWPSTTLIHHFSLAAAIREMKYTWPSRKAG